MKRMHSQHGVTLIELIIAIVVIGIAVVSILALLSSQASSSSGAMIQSQAEHIATAYLNEVLQKPFTDPGVVTGRNGYHFIDSYNGLVDNGARDQNNNPIAGLGAFTVSVRVAPTAINAVAAIDSKQVDVTVRHPNGVTVLMTGFRMRYP
jgi:MSHA pilin protein MshD